MKQQILAALAALLAFKQEMKAKFNGQIEKLPPLEGLEVASSVRDVLWSVDWAARRMKEIGEDVDKTAANAEELMAKFEKEIGDAAITAAVAAKTHIPAADHDAAITAAKDEVKTTLEADFNAKLTAAKTTFERKADAIAKVGAVAITALKDEDYVAQDFTARLAVVEERVKTLTEAGLTAEAKPKVFAALIAHGVDADGKAAFDAQLEVLKEASGGEFKASTGGNLPPPPKQAPPPGSAPAAKKSAVI